MSRLFANPLENNPILLLLIIKEDYPRMILSLK